MTDEKDKPKQQEPHPQSQPNQRRPEKPKDVDVPEGQPATVVLDPKDM